MTPIAAAGQAASKPDPVIISRDRNQAKRQVALEPQDDLEALKQKLELATSAKHWLHSFQEAIDHNDMDRAISLFSDHGWYRDMLVLDRSDFNSFSKDMMKEGFTKYGLPKIQNLGLIRPTDSAVVTVDGVTWLQSFIVYETDHTRGKGYLRLKQENGKFERAFTLFLTEWEVKGHEEFAFGRRPDGAEIHNRDGPPEDKQTKTWRELRDQVQEFQDADPSVLIVGAGQSGVFLAARLGAVGIPTLIIDKNEKVGDNWRNRYKSLVLHDPVWADHFPYIPYPPHWPKHTPKDKLADWFLAYAEAMELNFWGRTTLQGEAEYDEKSQKWQVTVVREGRPPRVMRVNHLVLATGFSGRPRIPNFKGAENFKGPIMHAAYHKGGEGWAGKKAVVCGTGNTGHDVAEDFWEQGADVTMVQRSSTYVASSKHGVPAWLDGFYEENGPSVDDADIMFSSLPMALVERFHKVATKDVFEKDKPVLDGLEKAGFKLNRFESGLFMKLFKEGGGYYLDVGCSKLIADGKIKVKQGQEIDEILPHGVRFADGTTVDADIIVMATGYGSMRESVRDIIGPKVADELPTLWNLDKQHEIHTIWRNTGIPGFFIQAGNLFQARVYSRPLALQIQMIELGLLDKNSKYPKDKENVDPRW